MIIYHLIIFILCGMILTNADLGYFNSNFQDSSYQEVSIEQQFLDVIDKFEKQKNVIDKFKGSEAIFLVGETGCGKSTIFNWLMGNQLRAVKNQDTLVLRWQVDVAPKDNYLSLSNISHTFVSHTSVPTFGKTKNGITLVDFPGWDDHSDWQYELQNSLLAAKISENYQLIKIVFICEQQNFESKRRHGLKGMIQKIIHFTQNKMLAQSVMLIITKVAFEDQNDDNWERLKQSYIKDIRNEFQKILNSWRKVDEQIKNIITSFLLNDIYIMRKGEVNKQIYETKESQELQRYILKLNSEPLKLQPHMNTEIINQFNNYFTYEFDGRKMIVKEAVKKMNEVFQNISNLKGNNTHHIIKTIIDHLNNLKQKVGQLSQSQIVKYDFFESTYSSILQQAREPKEYHPDFKNLEFIYDYFHSFKDLSEVYKLEIFDDEVLAKLETCFDWVAELYNIREVVVKERKISGKKVRNKVNEHRDWWAFWLPDKIPSHILDEDVEQYIQDGN